MAESQHCSARHDCDSSTNPEELLQPTAGALTAIPSPSGIILLFTQRAERLVYSPGKLKNLEKKIHSSFYSYCLNHILIGGATASKIVFFKKSLDQSKPNPGWSPLWWKTAVIVLSGSASAGKTRNRLYVYHMDSC